MPCKHIKKLCRIHLYIYSKREIKTSYYDPVVHSRVRFRDGVCCIKCLKYFKGEGW